MRSARCTGGLALSLDADASVHERLLIDGPCGTLKRPSPQEAFVDLEKLNRYSPTTATSS